MFGMGKLRAVKDGGSSILEPEHLIGRGPQCSLRLPGKYVSAQHAVIRWNSSGWELLDRGSRNGTRLNGEAIEPRRTYAIEQGSVIAFGHDSEEWILCDAAQPEVVVIATDTGEPVLCTDGMIGIPSNDDPQCVVYRDVDGVWKLEYPDSDVIAVRNGATFTAAGRFWKFSCPESFASTAKSDRAALSASVDAGLPEQGPVVALFSASSDEEYIELSLQYQDRTVKLGSRAHNYLLLTLARARLADHQAKLPDSSCGWTYKEQLADGLRMTPQQVDGEIFRIRKHFAHCGAEEAATIVERRARTKQLRIGISDIRITKL